MAKKNEIAVNPKSPPGGDLDAVSLNGAVEALAAHYKIDLSLTPVQLVQRAVEATNWAEMQKLGAGLALLKAKGLCEHGEFLGYLASVDMPQQRASELMAVAKLVAQTPEAHRKQLLQQPKKALLGMARMDDEILQSMLDTGALEEKLTLNEFHALLGKKDVALAAANNENQKLLHQVRAAELTGRKALDSSTPLAVGQLRREAASYAQDALACIHGFVDLAEQLRGMHTDAKAAKWVAPVSLSLVSLLQSVREACEQQLLMLVADFGLDKEIPEEAHLAMATPGPQEAQMIRDAMTGVLIEFGRNHAVMEYEQYKEKRKKIKTKGAMKKAPNAEAE